MEGTVAVREKGTLKCRYASCRTTIYEGNPSAAERRVLQAPKPTHARKNTKTKTTQAVRNATPNQTQNQAPWYMQQITNEISFFESKKKVRRLRHLEGVDGGVQERDFRGEGEPAAWEAAVDTFIYIPTLLLPLAKTTPFTGVAGTLLEARLWRVRRFSVRGEGVEKVHGVGAAPAQEPV
ncbi:hypothetical protein OPT61_g918 [Boeremia exigua]|uniref:Uncharacterized protein n=1 Tax=Boeremia exigua TaxID=749465 RepID=A0ACC2IS79_9PLEO|nr:hypothetical protein OPT61_g918 [Boeremia exigua]